MKIFISGGSGFVGKNLVEYLSNRYTVIAPPHSELELLDTNAVNEFFKKNKIDVVIHTANFGGRRNQKEYKNVAKNNLLIFFNLIQNSDHFKKMIFLGSGAEYDTTKGIVKVKESDFGKNIPKENYGFYKFVCSKYIENSDKIINLRLFGIFGKYEDYTIRFLSNIICRIIFDLPVEINQNRTLDYIFIDDFCRIIEYFINNDAPKHFYNIGTGNYFDLVTLAKKIKKISGKKIKIILKKPGVDKEYTCDNSLLMEELGNFKFTDMDKAILSLYNWYESNKDKIKKEELLKY